MPFAERATASVPGSIGNFGPGLDVLGAAVTGACDAVTASWVDEPGIILLDPGHPSLPSDPACHSSGIAARLIVEAALQGGLRLPPRGIGLAVTKGLPLAGGQGGSAASAVAGAVATNALLGANLDRSVILAACLEAEATVAGRHLDNIAPSLMGGVCLVRSLDPIDVVSLPASPRLRIVLAHPAQELRTADARRALPAMVERGVAIQQMANVAAIVAALHSDDLALLGRAMEDHLAEPARAALIPGFAEAKSAALGAGALGAAISGAGPTCFALSDSDVGAQRVSHAMRAAFEALGIAVQVRVARLDRQGARVEAQPVGRR